MKNLKYDLFNFKKDLPLEDYELNVITERYINNYDKFSEKELVSSLKETLTPFSWDVKVKKLVEGLEDEIKSEINTIDMTEKEFAKRKKEKNDFLGDIFKNKIIKII